MGPLGLRQPFCPQMDKGLSLQSELDAWGQEQDSGCSWHRNLQRELLGAKVGALG